MINFQTSPEKYQHWKLAIDGRVARLSMDVQEDVTLADGYTLKLNSYDLGVDIELADAIQRIRFEHPSVRAVVITSLKPRIFCAGLRRSTASMWRSCVAARMARARFRAAASCSCRTSSPTWTCAAGRCC